MAAVGTEDAVNGSAEDVFKALEAYPWQEDAEFQAGLSAILGSSSSVEQSQELTLRARCFYYARKHSTAVDYDGYLAWKTRQETGGSRDDSNLPAPVISPAEQASSGTPDAPYPTSFARIVDLITKGDPIPGVKDIPDTVLEGKESQSIATARKKPWEREPRDSTATPLAATFEGAAG